MKTTNRNSQIVIDLSQKFYSQVIDSLQDYSIFTLDKDLFITSWSSGSKKIFGYETEEIIGEHIDIIFTEEDKNRNTSKHEAENALRSGRAEDNRWHVCKHGGKIYALGIMFPLLDDDGSFLGYVKILKDLTEKWGWEEERKNTLEDWKNLSFIKRVFFP